VLHSGPALRSAWPLALVRRRVGRHVADRLEEACRDVFRDAPRAADRRRAASKFAALPSVASSLEALRVARARPVVAAALPVLPRKVAAAALPVLPREAEEAALRVAQPEAAAVVAPHAVAVALRVLVAGEAEPHAEAGAAAELRAWQRVALPAAQALPEREAARPSAAASACRPDHVLPWPVPSQQARFARATRSLQTASQ
jgi:hypothetical protein